jgi:hypothetical protein
MSKIRIGMFQFDFMVSRACGDQDAGTTTRGTMRKRVLLRSWPKHC